LSPETLLDGPGVPVGLRENAGSVGVRCSDGVRWSLNPGVRWSLNPGVRCSANPRIASLSIGVATRGAAGRALGVPVAEPARVGCGSPNVTAVFASEGSGDGVGLSLSLTVSSVSGRPELGREPGSEAAAAMVVPSYGVAVAARGVPAGGDATGVWVRPVDGAVWVRPADGAVGVRPADGVGVRARPAGGAVGGRPAAGDACDPGGRADA
jgi:hypothetical protein